MVVGMIMIPVPASSVREATLEESEAYIDDRIKDIAIHFPDFAPNALAYDHRRDAIQELQDGLGLNRGMAKRLLNEALALHPRNELVLNSALLINTITLLLLRGYCARYLETTLGLLILLNPAKQAVI
jgi:hypothetical protein